MQVVTDIGAPLFRLSAQHESGMIRLTEEHPVDPAAKVFEIYDNSGFLRLVRVERFEGAYEFPVPIHTGELKVRLSNTEDWLFVGDVPLPPVQAKRSQIAGFYPATVGTMTLVQDGEPIAGGDPVVILACRNEANLLRPFFNHYKKLGARNFLIVDNGSSDLSYDIYREQTDANVVIYSTPQSYREASSGIDWVNALLDAISEKVKFWAIVVDSDEHLVYPGCEEIDLPALVRYNDERGFHAVFSPIIDTYTNGPSFRPDIQPEDMRFFDSSDYTVAGAANFPFIQVFGGPRNRLVKRNEFSLKKAAMFASQTGVRLRQGTHALTKRLELARYSACLLHYKFSADFIDKVLRERTENRRTQSAHYKIYERLIQSDVSFYDPEISQEFKKTSQLVQKGLLWLNSDYLDYFSNMLSKARHQALSKAHRVRKNDARKGEALPGMLTLLSAASRNA